MSTYQGLSRAYRPQTFSAVLGQDPIITTLKNALRQKKTAQAYLFCGTRGTGKTTLARLLAKALNCPNLSKDSEPCNECSSCTEIVQGKNLNVLEIDGASNRGIDDIRQLNESVSYAPSSFGCKVFIIDEAHMLTKEAFNALLKTLEEPPPNVKFFLATTEAHKIPQTIVSRCQKFDLQRIPESEIALKLKEIVTAEPREAEEEALYRIASLADGSVRVAESLLERVLCYSEASITDKAVSDCLGIVPTEAFFTFDSSFEQGNTRFAFEWAADVFTSGKDLPHFFSCLLEHYRNVFTAKLGLALEKMPPVLQKKTSSASLIYTEEQLLYILDYLIEWHDKINKSPFKRVTLEMVLLHILRSKHRLSAADLVLRLEQLDSSSEVKKEEAPQVSTPKVEIPVLKEPVILSHPKKEEPPQTLIAQVEIPKEEKIALDSQIDLNTKIVVNTETVAKKAPGPVPASEEPAVMPKNFQIKYDTITRFAAVELEGSLTKE